MKKIILIILLAFIATVAIAQDQTVNGHLQINTWPDGGIRIGKPGETGKLNVPLGQETIRYNIDFSGYRDMSKDQIGARISAVRYNKFQENKAYVQNTALVFYTNDIGHEAGIINLAERMRIAPNGNIGIGNAKPTSKLDVNGTIRAKEIKIEATGWADFVFSPDYKLPTLAELKTHIQENKHLPNIPTEAEVKENGVDLGDMQIKLLQKIEELTLYVIEQDEKINQLEKRIQMQEK